MSAILSANQDIKTARNKSNRKAINRPVVRFRYAYSALMYEILQKRMPVTDDADRNYRIPVELKREFAAWVENDFTGNEDRFDAYRLPDC